MHDAAAHLPWAPDGDQAVEESRQEGAAAALVEPDAEAVRRGAAAGPAVRRDRKHAAGEVVAAEEERLVEFFGADVGEWAVEGLQAAVAVGDEDQADVGEEEAAAFGPGRGAQYAPTSRRNRGRKT